MSPIEAILGELREAAKTMSREEFNALVDELRTELFGIDYDDYA